MGATVRSREQLLHLLAEAAELEHNLLCSYLFAAFSLKCGPDEGLSADELDAVTRWRGDIMQVCMEEMTHLAQVANLMSAIGSKPHFNRPNLPVAAGYHPAGIQVGLLPFDRATLEHFIFLERPDSVRLRDPARMPTAAEFVRRPEPSALMPSAPDYETIGEFYELLAHGFEEVSALMGERRLFVGTTTTQLGPEEIGAADLRIVTTLAGALSAIEMIVVQGEGAPAEADASHFERFTAIKKEYERLSTRRPDFRPSRPVAPHPVMRRPFETDRTHVTGAGARPVLDAANAVYALMLRSLAALYDGRVEGSMRRAVIACLTGLMRTLAELSEVLTRLPVQDGSDQTAGVTFTMLRSTEGFAAGETAVALLAERLTELKAGIATLSLPSTTSSSLLARLDSMGAALRGDAPEPGT